MPRPSEITVEKYLAVPCAGTYSSEFPINIPPAHAVRISIIDRTGEEMQFVYTEEFLALEDAVEKYGLENLFFSYSYTSCRLCNDLRSKENSPKILSGKITPKEVMRRHPNIVKDHLEDFCRSEDHNHEDIIKRLYEE